VAERSRKYRAASAFARTGWCSDRRDKGHLPGSVDKEASRHFLGDAATPPRGDARRGLRFSQNDTSKPQMVVSAALDAPLKDFRKANLDRCALGEAAKRRVRVCGTSGVGSFRGFRIPVHDEIQKRRFRFVGSDHDEALPIRGDVILVQDVSNKRIDDMRVEQGFGSAGFK
jgi:hypothetical protein